MPNILKSEQTSSTASLVADIIHDVQKLVRQELDLAKAETKNEWADAKAALLAFGTAYGFRLIATLHVSLALVFFAAEVGDMPLWIAFLLGSAVFCAVALVLHLKAMKRIERVELIPKQTIESLKENVQWIKNRA